MHYPDRFLPHGSKNDCVHGRQEASRASVVYVSTLVLCAIATKGGLWLMCPWKTGKSTYSEAATKLRVKWNEMKMDLLWLLIRHTTRINQLQTMYDRCCSHSRIRSVQMLRFVLETYFSTAATMTFQCSSGSVTPPPPKRRSSLIGLSVTVRLSVTSSTRALSKCVHSSKKCRTVSRSPHSHSSFTLAFNLDLES